MLCGFKSFADKTEFEFGDGVTVVVGPNGCGKSNIVDAVKWVLGEQSAKSLRGGQMLDVIFNGANSRKSMGMAEVTLVFENTRGLINSDLNEIAVTRKLYRSGESEYLLNKQTCRLKDIREMFMDTGVGADAYSIIEQGKVEVLLQSTKQDRRSIFEEAAGVSKYNARKREALRKLERTDQNLLRLADIISELEKRLRSIKYQAGKARNYQEYMGRLRDLRLNQFLAEYYQLQENSSSLQQQLDRREDELAGIITAEEKAQARLSELEYEIDQLTSQMRQTENQILQCTSQITAQEERIEQGNNRSRELQEFFTRSRKQLQEQRQRCRQLKNSLTLDQKEIEEAQKQLSEQQSQLDEMQNTRQELALRLNDSHAQVEDEKSGLLDIVRRTAQLHNEISTLDTKREGLSGQKNRLNDRWGQIHTELEGLLTTRVRLEEKLQIIKELLNDCRGQLEEQRQQLAKVNQEKLSCSEDLAAAKEYRSGLLSRQQLLADLEVKLEGVDQGVRQILQAKKQDESKFYYVKGMVADLLRAEIKYAAIIDAALADKAQHLVVTDSEAILQDQENLQELKGRVQMICLDRLPAFKDGFDFSGYPEVKGKLIDLVDFAPDSQQLAWQLLGKTILVDNMEAALRLARLAPSGYRWVTLAGQVLEADGTVHWGPPTAQAGLVSRKSELRQLAQSISETNERITELAAQAQQYTHQTEHLEKNLQEMRTAIYENNTEEIETRSQLEQADQNIKRLKQEQPLITSEIESLESQIQEALNLQSTSQQSLNDLQSVNQQRQEQINQLEEVIRKLSDEQSILQEQITNMKVSLGQTQQRRVALVEKITRQKLQLQQDEHSAHALQSNLNEAQENYNTTQRNILSAETKIAELFLTRQEQQENSGQLGVQIEQRRQEKEHLVEFVHHQNQQRQQLQQKLHEEQMQLSENRLRGENLVDRAQEELGLNLSEKYESYQYQQIDWQAVADEISELRQKIERLGNVNLDAIGEQQELEGRLHHLLEQTGDLNDSKRQLEQLIERINNESKELFMKNFETIRAHFTELFRKLFGGGKADIVLEDPENILECGIEIIARPPGKQLQSISLLSGGEKTMTAAALLLAIFRSKPSPFCLLDEVDAALDEANIERFTLIVQEFLADSQFIIITHSRRTMAIGDTIYGITMQEQGVSKKVSVRFAGEETTAEVGTAVA